MEDKQNLSEMDLEHVKGLYRALREKKDKEGAAMMKRELRKREHRGEL